MYASHGFLRSDIGDVDVVYHEGQYHLFHLVLPNHDFIAHAVSWDGMSWRRVKNALFVGDPGSWDDDMLWTMHVTPDPDMDGRWRMFYTGLSRSEYGRVQRVGLAYSTDLLHWERVEHKGYPLSVVDPHYESDVNQGRKWVSFRDPYFYLDPYTGERLLLASTRVNQGPLVRRGCVGLAREVEPNVFHFEKPLHHPGLYDDVEVPNLFHLDGRYFLLGSIREDTKVHYWYSDELRGPYRNYYDNVLLPEGNYAARVCRCDDEMLLYNFFTKQENEYGRPVVKKLLPPPKRLVTDPTGRLRMRSHRGFDEMVREVRHVSSSDDLDLLFKNPHAYHHNLGDGFSLACPSGYEAFLLPGEYENLRLRAKLDLEGYGKCGLVLRVDDEGDGYYLSLDLVKGVVQMRAWGTHENPETEYAFYYQPLQAAFFLSQHTGPWELEVVVHGMYLEVSINGFVTLSLVDDRYASGRFGFYTESAVLTVRDLSVEILEMASQGEAFDSIYSSMPLPQDIVEEGSS